MAGPGKALAILIHIMETRGGYVPSGFPVGQKLVKLAGYMCQSSKWHRMEVAH